jgi:hypothetical protein
VTDPDPKYLGHALDQEKPLQVHSKGIIFTISLNNEKGPL